jgi:hypothetical protein
MSADYDAICAARGMVPYPPVEPPSPPRRREVAWVVLCASPFVLVIAVSMAALLGLSPAPLAAAASTVGGYAIASGLWWLAARTREERLLDDWEAEGS